jgi:hypothetical protein
MFEGDFANKVMYLTPEEKEGLEVLLVDLYRGHAPNISLLGHNHEMLQRKDFDDVPKTMAPVSLVLADRSTAISRGRINAKVSENISSTPTDPVVWQGVLASDPGIEMSVAQNYPLRISLVPSDDIKRTAFITYEENNPSLRRIVVDNLLTHITLEYADGKPSVIENFKKFR